MYALVRPCTWPQYCNAEAPVSIRLKCHPVSASKSSKRLLPFGSLKQNEIEVRGDVDTCCTPPRLILAVCACGPRDNDYLGTIENDAPQRLSQLNQAHTSTACHIRSVASNLSPPLYATFRLLGTTCRPICAPSRSRAISTRINVSCGHYTGDWVRRRNCLKLAGCRKRQCPVPRSCRFA